MIIFIKHIDIEGPDILDEGFQKKGYKAKVIELQNGDSLPDDTGNIEAVISLGGPMNVYEEDKYPFLKAENSFIQTILADHIPFVGICLGSQLLAKACGAKIHKSPAKEIGFLPIRIEQDPLFEGVSSPWDVFHWHEDMSELPPGARLLASSSGCPNQAFKVSDHAYGLQFHIEVTEQSIVKWIDKYFSMGNNAHARQKEKILGDCTLKLAALRRSAETLINNFTKLISP